jgi:tight adherence protein B
MLWISIAVFVGVAATIGALAIGFRDRRDTKVEDRLEMLAGLRSPDTGKKQESVIRQGALDIDKKKLFQSFTAKFNLSALMDQADVGMSPAIFFAICGGLSGMGLIGLWIAGANVMLIPFVMATLFFLPFLYLLYKRKKRLKKFAAQLPDALELIARGLRAGHSLAAGLSMVADEMPAPIGIEFARAYEEQNLGVPLEDALKSLCGRVPNLDLKFFATAVVLQRQTGGDLAEILDKIGSLIRERFRIWGAVQALTGEGRLSGIVLLALPPVLFLVVWYLNPAYSMMLFTDPLGKKMLVGAIILQILGALCIRKIVNIEV